MSTVSCGGRPPNFLIGRGTNQIKGLASLMQPSQKY